MVDENRDYAQVLIEDDGAAQVSYTYGDDLISQDRNGEAYFYHYDGLGSTRSLTDSQGSLANSYDYEAFGEVLNQTGAIENSYLFAGEQFDSTLNQYYLRARYYDQSQGRFTQQDTWMGHNHDPITLHKYLYANADPGNRVDPTGNFSLGSLGTAMNVMGTLASIATTTYDVFQIATGEKEFSAREFGTSILLNRLPVKYLKTLLKKHKARTGKDLKITCLKNSFVEGTVVHTKEGLIPIEEIQVGDYVLSYDEATEENGYQEVVHLIQGRNDYDLAAIQLKNGEVIEATLKHPFYVDSEWKDAGSLTLEDKLFTLDGFGVIGDVSNTSRSTSVYNLTVDKNHTYFVGEQGALVHNCAMKVNNMGEFFNTQFGIGVKSVSFGSGKVYKGAQIYRVSKDSGTLKKGDRYYLDTEHYDHLEVFDKRGKFRAVLNLDGTLNEIKTSAAYGRRLPKDLL